MIKEYHISGLDCANCAAKLEHKLKNINGLDSVNINFFNRKMYIKVEEDNLERVYKEILRITRKVEPSVKYSEEEVDNHHNNEEHHCGCNNEHHHDNEKCECEQHHNHKKHSHHKEDHIHSHHPLDKKKEEKTINQHTIMLARILFSLFMFVMALILKNVNEAAHLGFALVSYIVISYDIVYKAFRKIVTLKFLDENFLMMIASLGAMIIGEMHEAIAVMIFYQTGELCQNYAVDHSKKSINNLMDLKPEFARLKRIKGEKIERPNKVKVGEIIIVKPGEKIPLDGKIIKGNSSLDTSLITGESKPIDVYQGDSVNNGTINLTSVLEIEVTSLYSDSSVAKILNLIENAAASKSKSEKFITKFARWYTPLVVFLAILISIIPHLFFDEKLLDSIYMGLSFLVVSCPCALVISVPLAFFSGIGRASKEGILVKGGNYLETLSNVDTVVFDKTGTLTKGEFKVSKISTKIDQDIFIKYIASLENNFNHPIAKSILEYYKCDNFIEVQDVLDIPGYGVKGIIENKNLCFGNAKLMDKENINITKVEEEGSILYLAIDNKYVGYIVISDSLKDTSKDTIKELKKLGIKNTIILSGDNKLSVEKVKEELEIDEVYHSLNPNEKLEILKEKIDKNSHKTIYVGDGVNDAPSLALADVGIAMGGLGSDAAIESSDIVIMDDNIHKIADAIKIAKKTKRIVFQNIIFALLIKVLVLILVTLNLATMWIAIFADVGVALLAILNSIRLLKNKILS